MHLEHSSSSISGSEAYAASRYVGQRTCPVSAIVLTKPFRFMTSSVYICEYTRRLARLSATLWQETHRVAKGRASRRRGGMGFEQPVQTPYFPTFSVSSALSIWSRRLLSISVRACSRSYPEGGTPSVSSSR